MRNRSITGPLLLLVIGGLFLWRNLHPEAPLFDVVAQYWPFALIAWGLLRLIEVLIRPRDAWRYTFTGGEVVLVIFICIAGWTAWGAHNHGIRFNSGSLDFWANQYEYPVSASAGAAGIKTIVFENARGNITITGADTQDVSITGRKLVRAFNKPDADRADRSTAVEIVPQGDRLLVRTNQDRISDRQRISDDLTVSVPRGVAVESRANIGDYDISDVAGDIDLNSSRADVRLSRVGGSVRMDIGRSELIHAVDVKGKLDLRGRGSDVDLENVAGQVTIDGSYSGTLDFKNLAKPLQFQGRNTELRVEAIPGSISMSLSGFTANNLVGPVRLVTRSRDVRLERFTQSLDLDAQLGDVLIDPRSLPLSTIDVHSQSGRIELALPEKASFELQAKADRGEVVNDFGAALRKETEGRSATLEGKAGSGPQIRLTTDRGTIVVRKAGSAPAPATPPSTTVPPEPKSSEI